MWLLWLEILCTPKPQFWKQGAFWHKLNAERNDYPSSPWEIYQQGVWDALYEETIEVQNSYINQTSV